jgi:hypothetical protein
MLNIRLLSSAAAAAVLAAYGCVQAAAAAAGQWYPPVRSTLLLLSKLYRCIDTKIFAGLAQEAVAACTACVQVRDRLQVFVSGTLKCIGSSKTTQQKRCCLPAYLQRPACLQATTL